MVEARRRLGIFEATLVDSLVLHIRANLQRGSYDAPDAALALARVARTASTYLITGDAGVGKSTWGLQSLSRGGTATNRFPGSLLASL